MTRPRRPTDSPVDVPPPTTWNGDPLPAAGTGTNRSTSAKPCSHPANAPIGVPAWPPEPIPRTPVGQNAVSRPIPDTHLRTPPNPTTATGKTRRDQAGRKARDRTPSVLGPTAAPEPPGPERPGGVGSGARFAEGRRPFFPPEGSRPGRASSRSPGASGPRRTWSSSGRAPSRASRSPPSAPTVPPENPIWAT